MAQRKNAKSHSRKEGKTAPVESNNGQRPEGERGGAAKYSLFTWLAVLALLGVWSSMAVVYLDIVDYDSVIAKAQEFRLNFSEVLQGKLKAYDSDGDGDFDVEDAKVLLGLTKDGGGANAESLEEILNILAEEGSDWIYGFFTFLHDVVSSPVERGGEEEEEEEEDDEKEAAEERQEEGGATSSEGGEVKGVILDLQNQ
uniref:Un-named hu7910 n=1 Tax=Oryzias latipes TaxID=8090 RepID=A0A3P9KP43_ORYLA